MRLFLAQHRPRDRRRPPDLIREGLKEGLAREHQDDAVRLGHNRRFPPTGIRQQCLLAEGVTRLEDALLGAEAVEAVARRRRGVHALGHGARPEVNDVQLGAAAALACDHGAARRITHLHDTNHAEAHGHAGAAGETDVGQLADDHVQLFIRAIVRASSRARRTGARFHLAERLDRGDRAQHALSSGTLSSGTEDAVSTASTTEARLLTMAVARAATSDED